MTPDQRAAGGSGAEAGTAALAAVTAFITRVLPPVVTRTTGSPGTKASLPLACTSARRSPVGSCSRISTASSRVPKRSIVLPMTAPATAPITPIAAASRRPPTVLPAMPPTTPPAVPSALTLCDDGVASPCDDGLTGEAHVRGCFTASPAAHELHLRLPLPRLQAGARPYLRPEDGGDVPRAADGAVLLQGTEEVCASLTLPRGVPMPPAGWPLALYAHGTGGSFRSAVRDAGLPLSAIPVGDVTVGLAVVGWDGPMHGERRGAELDPEGLFYNFGNPRAARGNLAQGAADVFALVQAFEGLVIPAAESPTGEEIRFDPSHFALIGHSQGGTTGPLAAAFEPGIALDVWSGAGAGLVASLLAKTAPVDVPSALSVALQEVTESGLVPVNDLHPVLALIQGLFDPFDPLNHAGALADRPRPGQRPQHVLQVVGRDDHYTPNSTALTFGRLMRLALAKPLQIPEAADFLQLAPPIAGNVTRGEHTVTAVQVQTTPGDYDGHFVMFRDAATNAQYTQFLGTWLVDGVPTVIAR